MQPSSDDSPSGTTAPDRRRAIQALAELRFEIAVIVLLLLTIGATHYGDLILSKVSDLGSETRHGYTTAAHGDQVLGGDSFVRTDPHTPLQWSCTLTRRYRYPFCGYEIVLDHDTGHGADLSRFQTIAIDLDYRGTADSVHLYVKNFDPAYSRPGLRDTAKFNLIDLPVRQGHQTLRARLSDFTVAEWWIQKNQIPFRLSRPQFDNVVAFEIRTGNGAQLGIHRFRVHGIRLEGRIVPTEQWYLGIIGCWIVLICLYLVSRIIDLQHDVRRRRALQYRAQHEALRAQEDARHDHLTKLLNRLGMTDSYQRMIGAHGNRAVAIILIDIDHFKAINDRSGHMQGDEVLVAFAGLLRQNVREDDLVGRWGGEEFLLVARVGDAQAAMELANKLRGKVERFDFGIGRSVTASFGVEFCEAAPDLLGLGVAHADRALYVAKDQGRNRVVFHYPTAVPEPGTRNAPVPPTGR